MGWCDSVCCFVCFRYKSGPYNQPIPPHSWALNSGRTTGQWLRRSYWHDTTQFIDCGMDCVVCKHHCLQQASIAVRCVSDALIWCNIRRLGLTLPARWELTGGGNSLMNTLYHKIAYHTVLTHALLVSVHLRASSEFNEVSSRIWFGRSLPVIA